LAKDRAVLHRLFNLAERLEYRDGNPVGRVQPPKYDGRDPVLLTEDQYEALLRECEASRNPMLTWWALFLGETGTRCLSEALWLQWSDVDLQEGFVWIASGRNRHRTKSGKGRWIPMTRRLSDAMQEHFAQFRFADYGAGPVPWVFHNTHNRLKARAGERVTSMRHGFDAAARRAGLPEGFRRHDLRHRRTTTLLADGHSPVLVKEMLGHSDLRTTMGYTHLAREHLRALLETPGRQTEASTKQIKPGFPVRVHSALGRCCSSSFAK
jgi:integrase